MLAMIAGAALFAVGSVSVGETPKEATTARRGVSLTLPPGSNQLWEDSQSVPKVPIHQPSALFPDAGGSPWGAGPLATILPTPAKWSLPEHDPLTAYVQDVGFTIPTPAPPPEPLVSAAGALSEAQLREVLSQAGWPEHLHGEALRIIHCESRGKPDANNGIDKGLFQMNFSERATLRGSWFAYFGVDESLWADPVTNATVARWAYELSGWPKWSCAALVGLY